MRTVIVYGQSYDYERMDSDGVTDFWSVYYWGDFINVDVPCETNEHDREVKIITAIEDEREKSVPANWEG